MKKLQTLLNPFWAGLLLAILGIILVALGGYGCATKPGDTTSSPLLDSSFFPTASGNADGNGATNAVTWVGGTDYWGLPLKHSHATTSRGPRERPIVHTSAIIIPGAW